MSAYELLILKYRGMSTLFLRSPDGLWSMEPSPLSAGATRRSEGARVLLWKDYENTLI